MPAGGSISGTIIDGATNEPLPKATIALRSAHDSTLVTGALTERDGTFTIGGLRPGRYYARVSYVGMTTHIVDSITIAPGTMQVSLGRIAVTADASANDEVVVSARRDFMTTAIDRTIYKTSDLLVSSGGTAADLLRNIPSIEVDIDGNVSLRGNQNVAIQINGRPVMMSRDALVSFFRSLPASSIERIEVIPNPSAKYDPDGMSGIINIVLKQNEDRGMSGGINGGIGLPGSANIGGNISYGSGPWNLFANYGFNYGKHQFWGSRYQENRLIEPRTALRQADTGDNIYRGHSLNASVDYAFDEQNSLSLTAFANTRGGALDAINHITYLDAARAATGAYDRTTDGNKTGYGMDYRLAYKWVEKPASHELSVETRYSADRDDDDSQFREQDFDIAGGPLTASPARTRTTTNERNGEYSAQADYVRPLWENAKLEAGYKGSKRTIDNSFFAEMFDDSSGEFKPDVSQNNTYTFDEQIHAGYVTFGQEFGAFGVQAGLRAEQALTTFSLATTNQAFDNDYFSLFPSAFVTYTPAEGTQLKASYSKRINRPDVWALNPFSPFNDRNYRRIGNPYLKPEYTHAYEFNFMQYLPWGTITVNPYFRRTVDAIQRFERFDSSGIATLTFENFGTVDSYGADLIASGRISDWFQGFASVSLYQWQTDATNLGAEGFTNDAFGWFARLNATFSIGWGIDIQGSTMYRAPIKIDGGTMDAWSMSDIAIQKKLFEDKAKIGIRVSDPFNQGGFSINRGTERYYEETDRKWTSRTAMLTFSYTFGTPDRRQQRRNQGGGESQPSPDMGW
jgi:outer membrane receptor protein involved in Fe transport